MAFLFCCQELWTSCFVKRGPSFLGEGECGPVTLCVKRAGCPCFVCAGERGPDFVKGKDASIMCRCKKESDLVLSCRGNVSHIMDQ